MVRTPVSWSFMSSSVLASIFMSVCGPKLRLILWDTLLDTSRVGIISIRLVSGYCILLCVGGTPNPIRPRAFALAVFPSSGCDCLSLSAASRLESSGTASFCRAWTLFLGGLPPGLTWFPTQLLLLSLHQGLCSVRRILAWPKHLCLCGDISNFAHLKSLFTVFLLLLKSHR